MRDARNSLSIDVPTIEVEVRIDAIDLFCKYSFVCGCVIILCVFIV